MSVASGEREGISVLVRQGEWEGVGADVWLTLGRAPALQVAIHAQVASGSLSLVAPCARALSEEGSEESR